LPDTAFGVCCACCYDFCRYSRRATLSLSYSVFIRAVTNDLFFIFLTPTAEFTGLVLQEI